MTAPFVLPTEHWPLAGTRCIFRGKLMDYETAAFLLAMEAELGYTLTVLQGCYTNANRSSGGTHGGGGTIDLAPFDWERKVRVARSLGAAAWHRTPLPGEWPEHIHFVIRKHPTLSGAAAQQVTFFDQKPRKNGLAGEPVDPDQEPGRPTPTFHYPPKAPATPTFQGISLNDDFENKASDAAGIVAARRPLVMGIQEGWRADYQKAIRLADPSQPGRWKARQVFDSEATAGVAVIWDHRRLQRIGRHHTVVREQDGKRERVADPTRKGWGWQEIHKAPDTRMRGVLWQDVMFRDGVDHGDLPKRFRLASFHREPQRDRHEWPIADPILGLWFKRSPLPVLLFSDSNEHGGPEPLMSSLHSDYVWHAVGDSIDGAVTSLPVRGVKALPKRTSDHQPVVVSLG